MQENLTFEQAYARLEEILGKMNSSNIALEEALKLYEEADSLIGFCYTQLNEAEQKIEILTKNREGELLLNEKEKPQVEDFAPPQQAVLSKRAND